MKFSQFNIEHKIENNILLYNTFSSGILLIEEEDLNEYKNIKLDIDKNESLLKKELIKGNMIVEDSLNEVDLIKYYSNILRYKNEGLFLTIAPTLSCNFVCPYCYEKGVDFTTMNENTIENTLKFIKNNIKKDEPLSISWYGGEPLMAFNIIEKLTNEILKYVNIEKFSADIVTNGYLLTREYAKKMKEMKINSAQITLDGPPKIHDSRRKLSSGRGSFDRIIENIKNSCDLIDITIRVNLDNTNKEGIDELVSILKEKDIYDKVFLYIAKVEDLLNENNINILKEEEFTEYNSRFLRKNKNFSNISEFNPNICGAVTNNSFVIDPNGNLYKCWDEIGRKKGCIGNVKDGIELNNTVIYYGAYNPVEDNQCRKCNLLPICMGGCPYSKKMYGKNDCFEKKEIVIRKIENIYKQKLEYN